MLTYDVIGSPLTLEGVEAAVLSADIQS